jgi:hypothetical protein
LVLGAFFLLGGTVLFFAGLACLLVVFASIAHRLRASSRAPVYFRNRSSLRDSLLTGLGIVFIIGAQGFFWFHKEVSAFIPFDETVPRMQVTFLYEEYRTPRLVLQSSDQNSQLSAQIIPFTGEKISVGAEVIVWKKLFRILGMKDCYHVNGVYYGESDSTTPASLAHVPDYSLNGGPSGLASLITSVGKAFPADIRLLVSQPFVADSKNQYLVQISPDSIYSTAQVDNRATASYPK